jgi:itaconyl-CoA hydratase
VLPPYEYPRSYEDFSLGVVIEHEQRRVVTHMDNLLYARLSGHAHPFFFAYGAKNGDRTPVNPFLVMAVVGGLAVRATSQGAIANLGWDSASFPAQAYVGDELRAVTEILEKRISKQDASKGIIRIRTTGLNQEDRVVSIAIRSFLVSV